MNRIEESNAIDIAREYAESNGWPWHDESVYAWLSGSGMWCITTRPDTVWIANIYVEIDAETGDVLGGNQRPDLVSPISRRTALEIARKCVRDNGWTWREVDIHKDEFDSDDGRRLNCWTVGTNRDRLGGNATIIVDAETGDVLESSFVSR